VTDALTTLAIVGTARGGEPASVADPRADAVLTGLGRLGTVPFDGRVLLAAGVRAIARFAGALPKSDVTGPAAAEAELLPACSPRLDDAVAAAIDASDAALLLEALTAVAACGQRLPAARLADAGKVREPASRRAFAAVAGARGAWLARVHPPVAWLAVAEERSVDALERAFDEEKAAARVVTLTRARTLAPARARAWLEATWPTEKADDRATLLGALATGLSRDDEPFLEAALGDRSQGVRDQAAALLSQLPESAYVERLRVRAERVFALQGSTLVVEWPAQWQREDVRDALVPNVSAGATARAAYAAKLVGGLPLGDWGARFALSPAAFVAAAREASGVLAGLANGATRSRDGAWLVALLAHFRGLDPAREDRATLHHWTRALFAALPAEHASAEARSLLDRPGVLLPSEIYGCAAQWDVALGDRFLREVRASLAAGTHDLVPALDRAARVLPRECFAAALAPLELPPTADWLTRTHDQFQATVRLRHVIAEESALARRTA
jgi:hypothetical protein